MVAEATNKVKEELQGQEGLQILKFEVSDLESLTGKYDMVVYLDVLIHYPQDDGMIAHLASLAKNCVTLSFAPKTFYYDLLKRIGELFPGPSKATRAYLHSKANIEHALRKAGWKIRKGLLCHNMRQFMPCVLIEVFKVRLSDEFGELVCFS
ncbi:magnesium protoporphyrin IX methyltransferase, chloroplastic [Tanacetum coccineum]